MEKKLWRNTNKGKNCIIFNFYDFSQTYPQKNDVIRRYTKQVILFTLFVFTETDHRVTRKWKLLSFSDL